MKKILAMVLGVCVLLGGMATLVGCGGGDNTPKGPSPDPMKDMGGKAPRPPEVKEKDKNK